MIELKNTISELKNSPGEGSSREHQIKQKRGSINSDRSLRIIWSEEQKEKQMKNSEKSLRDLWDTITWTNLCTMGIPEREEKNNHKAIERNND